MGSASVQSRSIWSLPVLSPRASWKPQLMVTWVVWRCLVLSCLKAPVATVKRIGRSAQAVSHGHALWKDKPRSEQQWPWGRRRGVRGRGPGRLVPQTGGGALAVLGAVLTPPLPLPESALAVPQSETPPLTAPLRPLFARVFVKHAVSIVWFFFLVSVYPNSWNLWVLLHWSAVPAFPVALPTATPIPCPGGCQGGPWGHSTGAGLLRV